MQIRATNVPMLKIEKLADEKKKYAINEEKVVKIKKIKCVQSNSLPENFAFIPLFFSSPIIVFRFIKLCQKSGDPIKVEKIPGIKQIAKSFNIFFSSLDKFFVDKFNVDTKTKSIGKYNS